jgi:polysaccharide biosynthesis protein PslG
VVVSTPRRSTASQRRPWQFLLSPYSIFALTVVAAFVSSSLAAESGSPNRAAAPVAVALPFHEPAITVSVPDSGVITAGDFGADIVNYDDTQWGPDAEASWPPVPLGIVRIWDDGSTWADLEPSPAKWEFATLDRQVAGARSEGAQVLYVLGQTPAWASSDRLAADIYGGGAPAMPTNLAYWEQYVRTVATRYKGRITAYEVWDEADASTFHGSPAQMVELATIAYRTIKQIDPTATVLTPSFTQNSLTDGWLNAYLSDGGGKVADAFAGHAYADEPEGAGEYLLEYRAALKRAGLELPIWMTEVGYSGYTSAGAPLFSQYEAEAYVARSTMDMAEGGARSIWYGANSNGMWLSLGEQGYPGDAVAYKTMLRWLEGSTPDGCGGTSAGPYTGLAACYLTTPGGAVDAILYDSDGIINLEAPARGDYEASTVSGATSRLLPGSVLDIGASPVLISQPG